MNALLILAGQIGVVVLVAIALWNPALPGQRAPVHLVLLLDDSASMSRTTRDASWQALAPRLEGLPAGSRISVVRFGAQVAVELAAVPMDDPATQALLGDGTPPRRLPLDDRQTDVATAIRAGLSLEHAGLVPTLVLVSDGAATLGDTAAASSNARAAGLPVHWWRPPVGNSAPDAWIARLHAPARVRAGEPLTLTALLAADAHLTRDLLVRVGDRRLAFRSVDLSPGEPLAVRLEVDPPISGLNEIQVELLGHDRIAENDRRSILVVREGPAPIVLLSPHPDRSAVGHGLRTGGWPLLGLRPVDFWPARLDGAQALVLEEIAVSDLSEPDWAAIARAVRVEGMGLVVLGGPGTFAAGGYRHSTLEGLLPVLAEVPRPEARAAVVFAIDSSGSMAQPTGASTAARLALARRAVAESARSLTANDRGALIAFDVQARTLLPLRSRPDQAATMAAALAAQAGGGTRIAPALERTLTLLAPDEGPERLLVLATDGRFTDAEQVPRLADALAAAHVDVIVIAIGAEADTAALERLTAHGRGRLLRATDQLELPRLMQTEVQSWRSSVREGPVTPQTIQPLPFHIDNSSAWPAVDALQLTRRRTGAQLYLATPDGEPLLASAFAGTGRVVALPAGLGAWAAGWTRWTGWGSFLGGLIQWAAGAAVAPSLDVRIIDGPTTLRVAMEATDAHGEWAGPGPMPVQVRDPAGAWHALSARAAGPGRWAIEVPASVAGRYDVIAGPPGREQRLSLMHEPLQELLPVEGQQAAMERLAAQGLLSTWSPASAIPAPRPGGGARGWLATLALALFVLILTLERMPPGPLTHWPSLRRTRRRAP